MTAVNILFVLVLGFASALCFAAAIYFFRRAWKDFKYWRTVNRRTAHLRG